MRQSTFQKTFWDHRFSHGGSLRTQRHGRRARPLSSRDPIHLVFKADRTRLNGGFRTHRRFRLASAILRKYSTRFFVKVEQVSFQGDHIHLVVRILRRSHLQSFLRVFAGQIAQRFQHEGLITAGRGGGPAAVTDSPKLWKYRPFTRVVRGERAYRTLKDYVQLNEKEAMGKIPYRKSRLSGLSKAEREALWS